MQLRIQPHRSCIHIRPGWQRHNRSGCKRITHARIGKEQHPQIEVRFLLRQQSVGKVAIALLLLQLRFHYVGMCCFAGALPLLGQLSETGGFIRGAPGHTDFVVVGQCLVEEAGHGIDQAAACNFELRRGHGLRGSSSGNGCHLLQSQRVSDDALAGIFANRVVGNEARSRLAPNRSAAVEGAVRLGIQSLVVVTWHSAAKQPGRWSGPARRCVHWPPQRQSWARWHEPKRWLVPELSALTGRC